MMDFKHEAHCLTNELYYREGPMPKHLQFHDAQLVSDTIERALREAFDAGRLHQTTLEEKPSPMTIAEELR